MKYNENYTQVHERILLCKRQCEENGLQYSLQSDYEYFFTEKMWIVKATLTIWNDDRPQVYEGLAKEVVSDDPGMVNFSSALENCQTSAWGRAFAAYGIGINEGIATVDELEQADKFVNQRLFDIAMKRYDEGDGTVFKGLKDAGFEFTDLQKAMIKTLESKRPGRKLEKINGPEDE